MDASYFGASYTINEWNTVWKLRLWILTLWPEAFLHGSVDLGRHGRVNTVEEVLQIPLIWIVGKVNEVLEFLFESVSQETIVDSCYTSDLDASDSVESHLFCVETWSYEVDAGGEPFIIRLAFLKPNIAASLQFRH